MKFVWFCRKRMQKFYNCKTWILLSWQSLFGLLVQFFINDKTRGSSLPLSLTMSPLCLKKFADHTEPRLWVWHSVSRFAFGSQSVFVWHWAEGGIVLVGWWVHNASQLCFKVSFKGDIVDAMNVVNQAVHRKRTRDWRRSNRYWGHVPSWDGVKADSWIFGLDVMCYW